MSEDDSPHPPEKPWRPVRGYLRLTSPLMKGPGIFSPAGRESAWNGRVLEEGQTPNEDRWLYVVFEGFGRPFSQTRGEQVDAAFIELHVGRSGLLGKREIHARVRFAVARYVDPEDEKALVYAYGPYVVEVSEATNKWEMVKYAVDKTLPLYVKSPLLREGGVPPNTDDSIYETDVEWVAETLFPEHMIRGLQGLEGDDMAGPLIQEPGGVRAKYLKVGDKVRLWGQTVELLRVHSDKKGTALNFKYLTGPLAGQFGHEDVPSYDTRTFVLR